MRGRCLSGHLGPLRRRAGAAAVDGQPIVTIGHRVVAEGDRLVLGGLLGPAAGPSPWGWASDAPVVQVDCGLPGGLGFAGLVWLGARIYDPATRHFLSPDPLPGVLGTSVAANPYHYADNDPLNRCDPTGLNGQPISIDDFNQMKDDATGFQWDNVAKVGIAVAGAVVMGALIASGVGIVGMAVAGGIVGATTQGANGIIDGKPLGEILLGMAVGGVLGAAGGAGARVVGGWVASRVAAGATTRLTIAADLSVNAVTSTGQEAVDSYLLPNGDGRMDWEKPIIDTVAGTTGNQLGAAGMNCIIPDIDLSGVDLGPPTGGTGLGGPGASPLAPPSSVPPIILPNAGAPRLPGSSFIDPNADLVRTPGGILLPPGVRAD